MSLGRTPEQEDAFESSARFCASRVSEKSIYALLHREGRRLFPDETFADLFTSVGRRSVPGQIVAVVMVLQRLEGLSDREAVERFTFDLRWKYAAGGLDHDHPGFVHTVLVDMRERLRKSARPNRIFETVLEVARKAGHVGAKRVLDSTPLYDAVATQDTVTLIRSAIRSLLRVVEPELRSRLQACLKRDDDYISAGKPNCDWDDEAARETLVDALARDAYAALALLDGMELSATVAEAAKLVAAVVAQDLEENEGGLFRIARRVAKDRIISVVDPEARHGHKTAARGFDGYKGHVSIDPDSELVTATAVTSGNVADGEAAEELLKDFLQPPAAEDDAVAAAPGAEATAPDEEPLPSEAKTAASGAAAGITHTKQCTVYGDSSYGTAELVEKLEGAGVEANVKVQPPSGSDGHFSKSRFEIDLEKNTVKCPAGRLVKIGKSNGGGGLARFGAACSTCSLRAQCTDSKAGRVINVHPREATLHRSRERQASSAWKADYRATRPKVERKLAHLMFRRHGGRRARVRGRQRIGQDFALLSAAHNLKRLAVLGFGQ